MKCAENLSKRAVLVQLIVENMVTCFLEQCFFLNSHVSVVYVAI